MTDRLILHPKTKQALQRYARSNTHALLLVGPSGSGKTSLALQLAAERQSAAAYQLRLRPDKAGTISIEVVRGIEHFLSRRIPAGEQRTVMIEDASALSLEAQNALLKMLEEPPVDTLFILTVDSETSVLPTIHSRTISLQVMRPELVALRAHFQAAGFTAAAVQRAELMSGGLPGLMQTLLTADADHPLSRAATLARDCVQKTSFERLCLVDALAKDRQLSLDTLFMLQQMAHVSLAGGSTNRMWQAMMAESYAASEQLRQNAQPKLVLTNLMLKLTV